MNAAVEVKLWAGRTNLNSWENLLPSEREAFLKNAKAEIESMGPRRATGTERSWMALDQAYAAALAAFPK